MWRRLLSGKRSLTSGRERVAHGLAEPEVSGCLALFDKSRRNIAENPHALVIVLDPDTRQGGSLRVEYVRTDTSGPLFGRMALRIEAIASYCGLKKSSRSGRPNVYRVPAIEPVPEET